jgi:ABC-2 type transport system permease protein
MKWHRIYAIILRNLFFFRRSYDRITDAFDWPAIDVIVWGMTSSYFTHFAPPNSPVVLILLSGILFWIIVYRGQYEINVGLLDEVWNKNLINLFVAPLKFSEWILSLILIGVIKTAISFVFATLLALFFYKIHFLIFGWYFLPFTILLLMTGWWVSFFVTGLILRYGTRVQAFAWTTLAIISPFSAIYYPVSILPHWAQLIASILPTSYIFEGMRQAIQTGHVDPEKLWMSFLLNIVFLVAATVFLKKSFNEVLEKGLVKVY